MERRGPNQQILERNREPAAPQLPGNPARHSRDSSGHRINHHVGDQIVHKRLALLTVRFQISSTSVTTDIPITLPRKRLAAARRPRLRYVCAARRSLACLYRRLLPRGPGPGLPLADNLLDIGCVVLIQCDRVSPPLLTLPRQLDQLRKRSPLWIGGLNHRDSPSIGIHNDFFAMLHLAQHGGKVTGNLGLGHVHLRHISNSTPEDPG